MKDDSLVEADQLFQVNLTAVSNATISSFLGKATAEIVNDDELDTVKVSVDIDEQPEGDVATAGAVYVFTVERENTVLANVGLSAGSVKWRIGSPDFNLNATDFVTMPLPAL